MRCCSFLFVYLQSLRGSPFRYLFGIQLHSFCFPVLKSSLFLKGFCLTLSIVSLYMLNVFRFFLFLLFCTYFYHPYLVMLASPPPPLLLLRRRRQPRLSWSRHSVACVAGDTADYYACTHVYEGKPPQTQNLTQLFPEFSSVSRGTAAAPVTLHFLP